MIRGQAIITKFLLFYRNSSCSDNDWEVSSNIDLLFSSITSNVIFLFYVSIIFLTDKTLHRSKKRVLKYDSAISFFLIVNAVVDIFSLLETALSLCQFTSTTTLFIVDSVVTILNAVIILPTFYILSVFKCRSKRRYVLNSVATIVYTFALASINLYEVCRNENVGSVNYSFSLLSSICQGFVCLHVVSNLAAQAFVKRFNTSSASKVK